MAVYWALLSMDCAEDEMKYTELLFMLKGDLWEQSQYPAGYIHWDGCAFPRDKRVLIPWTPERSWRTNFQSVSCGKRDSGHGLSSSHWQIFPQTAVLWQFHDGAFLTPQSGFEGTRCTRILCACVSFFLYCTFKHGYVSIYCKTERGDRQEEAC